MRHHRTHPVATGLVACLILLGWWSFSTLPEADAHAILESASPADQSVVPESPASVKATFSEPVRLVVGSMRVFDSQGNRVDTGVAEHGQSSSEVTVHLESDLPDGSYAVAWRVISADTHPVHGGWVFSVGSSSTVGGLDQYLQQSSQPAYEAAEDVLRALAYLGAFVVVGGVLFEAFVARDLQARRRRIRGLAIVGVATVLAELAQVPVAAIRATDEGLGALFEPGVAGQVLGQGVGLTLGLLFLALVVGLVSARRSRSTARIGAVAAMVLLAGAFVASGHTRTTDPAWLVSVVDAVHVAAGAAWVGGLVMLWWSLRDQRLQRASVDAGTSAIEVAGFSRIATVGIVAVAVAGGILAWFEVGSWEGLFTTGYGWLVIAKIALLGVLAALGAFNRFRLVPAVNSRPDRAAGWKYLRRTLRIEAIAMVAVLAVTGVLVGAIPSRTDLANQALFSDSAPYGSGSLNIVIDPARTGRGTLHLYLLDSHGRPEDDEVGAVAELTQKKLGIGPFTHELHRAGPGHYLTNGTLFTVGGDWQVTVRVTIDEFTQRSATVEVKVRG